MRAYCVECESPCVLENENKYMPSACPYGSAGKRSHWHDEDEVRRIQALKLEAAHG